MLELNNYKLITGYAENARGMVDLKHSFRLGSNLSSIVIIDHVLIKDRFNQVAFDGSNLATLCENHENVLIQEGNMQYGYYKSNKKMIAESILSALHLDKSKIVFSFLEENQEVVK